MFRPIKNFITYIQKNAGSGSIFGSATPVVSADAALKEQTEIKAEAHASNPPVVAFTSLEKTDHSMNRAVAEIVHGTFAAGSYAPNDALDSGDDDIEKQIKSSIMVRKPITAVALNDSNASPYILAVKTSNDDNRRNDGAGSSTTVEIRHNYTLPAETIVVVDDDELDDFRDAPRSSSPISVQDFLPASSDEVREKLSRAEETEDQHLMSLMLDITPEITTFPDSITGSEVIVLPDAGDNYDLNCSIGSEVPSEDPLAIDDFAQPTISDAVGSNDEATDILWMNIDEMNTKEAVAPADKSTVLPVHVGDVNTSLNQSSSEEHAEELRSDGSDSGLGCETSVLQTSLGSAILPNTPDSVDSKGGRAAVKAVATTPKPSPQPLRSNLKRRLEVLDDVGASLDASSSLATSTAQQKKAKRSISFDSVQVYYFQRQQGFGCVPSAGGCTLGMSGQHIATKTLTLAEHAAELRRAHRLQVQEGGMVRGSSSDDSEESEEDYLSEGSGSDQDAETNGFLQPVSPKHRRALLKAAGVRKIDVSEKTECRNIRNSREVCGCTCRDFCDPDTCACSRAGIKCQVDRSMFPCGCSREACGNTIGRIEFNPARVRTHYMHTIMRLDMENRQQHTPAPVTRAAGGGARAGGFANVASIGTVPAPTADQTTTVDDYYALQPPSNYSSGYASPAYTSEPPAANYYQAQGVAHGQDMSLPTPPLALPAYQLDSLDSNLFSGTVAATPSYGELMPIYNAIVHHHSLSYATTVDGSAGSSNPLKSHVSPYSAYHPQASASYYNSTFSSCAVPSLPPYGTATTTAATTSLYHETTAAAVHDSIAPSSADGNNGCASFISLNTPIGSSSHLSQINDMLKKNRNTTATLVDISQCGVAGELEACRSSIVSPLTTESIDTPPIEDAHKSCLAFEELAAPPPLNPTPIVAVLERGDANVGGA